MKIKLELTVQEINIVLKYLGKGSYDEVAGLIAAIKTEGDKQILELENQQKQLGLDI